MLSPDRVNHMTKLIGTIALSGVLTLLPALPRAQEDAKAPTAPPAAVTNQAPPPSTTPPAVQPPPPPASETPPPIAPRAEAAPPQGQWVYTSQYGWVWMPYGDGYAYLPPGGYGEPSMYVYVPAYGWSWLAAPWLWGYGPWPYFGVWGPARFAWYGHGWWRHPGRWHYAPQRGYIGGWGSPGFRGGFQSGHMGHGWRGHR